MAESSIKSGIQLESYKMDKISFEVVQELGVLASKNHSDCEIKYQFSFRNALRIKKEDSVSYVTGLKVTAIVHENKLDKDIASGEFEITGLFSSGGTLDKATEETLIKCQAPTILFPYLRATISLILTTSGFSTMIMPLVNVSAIAKTLDITIDDAEVKQ